MKVTSEHVAILSNGKPYLHKEKMSVGVVMEFLELFTVKETAHLLDISEESIQAAQDYTTNLRNTKKENT